MCGICTEQIALHLLEKKKNGEMLPVSDSLTAEFLLQETDDFIAALHNLSFAENGTTPQIGSPETLICRGISLFLQQGLPSSEYDSLFGWEAFHSAIGERCSAEVKSLTMQLSERFPLNNFLFLYEKASYLQTEGNGFGEVSQKDMEGLLNAYIQLWLEEDKRDDIRNEDAFQPTGETSHADQNSFDNLFRCLWYSLNGLDLTREAKKILLEIATRHPRWVPFFDAKDLWLQRSAALRLYDQDGLWPMLERMDRIRPTLFYYLDLKRGLKRDEKFALSEQVMLFPSGMLQDEHFDIDEWVRSDDFLG